METKFTPGPWHVGEAEVVRDQNDTLIASVGYGYLSAKETEAANARLIAAAPELLATLQAMFSEDGDFDFTVTMLVNARAAIAKATGA